MHSRRGTASEVPQSWADVIDFGQWDIWSKMQMEAQYHLYSKACLAGALLFGTQLPNSEEDRERPSGERDKEAQPGSSCSNYPSWH